MIRKVWCLGAAVLLLGGGTALVGCGGGSDGDRNGRPTADDREPATGDEGSTPGENDFERDVHSRPIDPKYAGDNYHPGTGDDGKGDDGKDDPEPDEDECSNEHDEDCDDRQCFLIDADSDGFGYDISYLLIDLPCPGLVDGITVTDLDRPGRVLERARAGEPSAATCKDRLTGFKVEGVNASRVKVCVEADEPIDRDAITIQVKAGPFCDQVEKGYGSCECETNYCPDKPPKD